MTAEHFAEPSEAMRRAVELAARGVGHVEPNPPVGAVVVDEQLRLISEGWHERFGGPHAEINALKGAGNRARGATLFVTLEPCCHFGKTPPCTEALIRAGVRRVVVGLTDLAPHNSGRGIEQLRKAGIEVDVGLLRSEVERLTAPFIKLTTTRLPYVHAKWAMTLDGKIATRTGQAKWISGEESRRIAHRLRGRMDAVIVGIGTVLQDDPLLTARPPGPRTAVRVVVDSAARTPLESQLVRTAKEVPLLIAASRASESAVARLKDAGAEVLRLPADSENDGPSASGCARAATGSVDLLELLRELGRRDMTNVLVEGGSRLLGSFFDEALIDECHVFVAPKLLGSEDAPVPIAGKGCEILSDAVCLDELGVERLGCDVYLHGRIARPQLL